MHVEPSDCTVEELIGYLDILEIGSKLTVTDNETKYVFTMLKIDCFSWMRTDSDEVFDILGVIHRYANYIHNFEMNILCIDIGVVDRELTKSFWPIVNPWKVSSNGALITLTQKEFYADILSALNNYKDIGDNELSPKTYTIILNLHNSVNANSIVWAIAALNDVGYKNLKLRCAEEDYPMIKVSMDVPEEDI